MTNFRIGFFRDEIVATKSNKGGKPLSRANGVDLI
jgi:hypothetical protein